MTAQKITGRIAFQGEPGAYSHQACHEARPDMEALPCRTFEDVIEAVRRGDADLAMLPVENSTYGRVADIHHLLPESGLHIINEAFVRVHINLLGVKGTKLNDVRAAMSHTVLLGQCRGFLQSHGLERITGADTAGSAKIVAEKGDPSVAALASELAGDIYGLDLLARHIEDKQNNTTRFLVMSREPDLKRRGPGPMLTTLVVPRAQHSRRTLQGDGRVRDQWREHDQTGKLHGRRQLHRDAVLCRYRRPPRRQQRAPGAGRVALFHLVDVAAGRLPGRSAPPRLNAQRPVTPRPDGRVPPAPARTG